MNPANADLHALQRGDDAALSRLIERWRKPLFSFAWGYLRNTTDANDLVAEVFVRLYQQRARLDPNSNLSAWLFTILTNLCHNHYRWRQRHPAVSLDAPLGAGGTKSTLSATVPGGGLDPAVSLERREAVAALAAAVEALPHDLKVPLLLHQYERLDYVEIGTIIGCSARGVETRLYRARQFLRAEMAPHLREAGRA
ncbi:MAG TPA: RNA polymerase sigma factor [Lacunisphaera sp.]|nr:RNA polymerase sigma factor [Lacunisphaera sp.]